MNHHPHQARSREELIQILADGGDAKFLFFWGHTPKADGSLGASCFSQWFELGFEIGGVTYRTPEHYMMAEKARLFGDEAMEAAILAASSPGEAKKLGRRVADFDPAVWERHRFEIVVTGNMAKFSQNQAAGKFLAATGTQVIVEAAPRDRIWGIGLGRDNPKAMDPNTWRGHNLLGFALMEVRGLMR